MQGRVEKRDASGKSLSSSYVTRLCHKLGFVNGKKTQGAVVRGREVPANRCSC